MSSTESVNRLQQKLAMEPGSKVFLPLAEHYRRAGQLERAAAVLRSGLKHNPGYVAARVALGRVVLEQGREDEARDLLTDLVREAPDNLLAQKLLREASGGLDPRSRSLDSGSPQEPAPEVSEDFPSRETDARIGDEGVGGEPEGEPGPGPVWASPEDLRGPESFPAPEPGIWKPEDLEPPWREAGVEENSSASTGGDQRFKTVRLDRADLGVGPDAGRGGSVLDPVVEEPPASPEFWEPESQPDMVEMGSAAAQPAENLPDAPEMESAAAQPPENPVALPGDEPVQERVPDPAFVDETHRAVESAFGPGVNLDPEPNPVREEIGEEGSEETTRILRLARLYRRQGDLDRSATVYRDLLDSQPHNEPARRELMEVCGEGLTEISDSDVVPPGEDMERLAPRATVENVADSRRRKVAFLQSWLEHIRVEG
ncbi:MAG: tetratricopeptide repeat protein [Acidobacteriota bacterium]